MDDILKWEQDIGSLTVKEIEKISNAFNQKFDDVVVNPNNYTYDEKWALVHAGNAWAVKVEAHAVHLQNLLNNKN